MKLSQLKNMLDNVSDLEFRLPDGSKIPAHFHITEAGLIMKQFTDCGRKLRSEMGMNFQIWTSVDTEHRLRPDELMKIITIAENSFGIADLEIEIEYQTDTIGKYGLDFHKGKFYLTPRYTDCLARENCAVNESPSKYVKAEETSDLSSIPGVACS